MLWEFLYFAGKVCGDAKASRSPNIMKAITRARTNVKGVFFGKCAIKSCFIGSKQNILNIYISQFTVYIFYSQRTNKEQTPTKILT